MNTESRPGNADLTEDEDDLSPEFRRSVEQYEEALRQSPRTTPEQWLVQQAPKELREFLAHIHWVYRATQPVGEAAAVGVLPTVIDDFAILGELGRGGMGVVYRARQRGLNREVAVKVLLAGTHAGEEGRTRFRFEAAAAARLQHPRIVQIFGVGEHENLPYLVLELVAGGSLKQQLDGTPQPARDAARLVELLARAMHHAHERGVIHRDLKPANVLLVPSNHPDAVLLRNHPGETGRYEPKITDFGLARQVGHGASGPTGAATQTGAIVGTPSYMAPEQAGGGARQAGPAADIYSLGAILYELLTGRPPFKGETPVDTLLLVQHEEPVPLRRLHPKVPRDLETICLKCLEKEPRRRYAAAADLADDLGRFLANKPIAARPVRPWERAGKCLRRNPGKTILASAVGLAGIGALLFLFLWQHSNALRQRERGQAQRKMIDDHWTRAEGELREGRVAAAADTLTYALANLDDGSTWAEERLRLESRRDLFRRLDEFWRSSDQAWFLEGEENSAQALAACARALQTFGVLEHRDWWVQAPAAGIPAELTLAVQRETHRLLLLQAAMRIVQAFPTPKRSKAEPVAALKRHALDSLDRALDLEQTGVVAPSKTTEILRRGANRLPISLLELFRNRPATTPENLLADLSAEDGFFLGVLQVYLAKHQSDIITQTVKRLGPEVFDYDHPRNTAIEMLRRAVQLEPRHYWSCFMLGRILAFAGPDGKADYQEAVQLFNLCISLRPGYSRGYEQRGLVLAHLALQTSDKQQHARLRRSLGLDLEKALVLAPDDPSTSWVRGQTFRLLKETPSALAAYTRALELEVNLQDKLSRRNQLTDPKTLVKEVLEEDPENPAALRLRELISRASQPR
jgi:serine/threonine protein kinase/tetratricopeptide (TPR) repeat protein